MNGNADPLALTSGALRKFYATAARCGRNRIRTGTTKSSARATLTTCPTRSPSLQQLAAGGVARDRAEVIAKAIRDGVEQGDHVTSDQFKAGPRGGANRDRDRRSIRRQRSGGNAQFLSGDMSC